MEWTPSASQHAPREALGRREATDSGRLPPDVVAFPWHLAATIAVSYLLGTFGWHWAYLLPLFWLLVVMLERQQRRDWSALRLEANTASAATRKHETVTWLNELLRVVWPMYEAPVARWAIWKAQPYLDESVPHSLGIHAMRIRHFSFGRVGDRRHRLAPIVFDNVRMVDRFVSSTPGKDPKLARIRYVMHTDIHWHAGAAPSLELDIMLGPKFLSLMSVNAQVQDVFGKGTLRLELDWIGPYPYLGSLHISFVETPELDFKLSIMGSPDVMALAPPLQKYLLKRIDESIRESMMGINRLTIPLYEWYGEEPNAANAAATAAAALQQAANEGLAGFAMGGASARAGGAMPARPSRRKSRHSMTQQQQAGGLPGAPSRSNSYSTLGGGGGGVATASSSAAGAGLPKSSAGTSPPAGGLAATDGSSQQRAALHLPPHMRAARTLLNQQQKAAGGGGGGSVANSAADGGAMHGADELLASKIDEAVRAAASFGASEPSMGGAANGGGMRRRRLATELEREASMGGHGGVRAGGTHRRSGSAGGDERFGRATTPPSANGHHAAPWEAGSSRSQPSSPRAGRFGGGASARPQQQQQQQQFDARDSPPGFARPRSASLDMTALDGLLAANDVPSSPGMMTAHSSSSSIRAGFMTMDEFFAEDPSSHGGGGGCSSANKSGGSGRSSDSKRHRHAGNGGGGVGNGGGHGGVGGGHGGGGVHPLSHLGGQGLTASSYPHYYQGCGEGSVSGGEGTNGGDGGSRATSEAHSSTLEERDAPPPSPLLMTSEPPHPTRLLGSVPGQGHHNGNGAGVAGGGANGSGAHGGGRGSDWFGQLTQFAEAVVGARRGDSPAGAGGGAAGGQPENVFIAADLPTSGAVGELSVEILDAVGLLNENLATSLAPNLAPSLAFGLEVGDGDETRGSAINAAAARVHSGGAKGHDGGHGGGGGHGGAAATTRLEVRQRWTLAVHDSLTQRLRLRVYIKELAKELAVLSTAELHLSDLRLDAPSTRALVLPLAGRRDPALVHLRLTYRMRAQAR